MSDNISLLVLAPALNVQLILDGIMIGAIFALAAYGLALVWGVMNVKNLAQGDFVIMGGYVGVLMSENGIHPILALPVAIVLMFGFGWLIYRIIIVRVIERDLFTSLLATFGLALVIQQLLNLIFGSDVRTAESGFGTLYILGGLVTIAEIKLVSLGLAALLAIMIVAFMKLSRMGQSIRATAQNARAARIMGIDTDRVYAFTYALNAAICGAAGVLISMIWVIQPFFGISYSIRSFVIVTAAGLGNLPGVILAALGLGVAEQFSGFIIGAEFQQATVVSLLLLVLIIRQLQMRRHRKVVI
ncbi:MAG: branched-chain amino acid ABC transporter permease [Alphaproteobacteria bacterium]|nr:MAG: branched-chain amino acid ABC transporter permease [Alphaproteobacteria bacterium]